jgi:MarR family transcriptional regulator, organic hydroperoxide resistance regulator
VRTRVTRLRPVPGSTAGSGTEERQHEVLALFRQIVATARRHFQSVQKECGISGAQLWALSHIQAEPGLKVGDLSRRMSVHQSTASNLLDRLERRGLVRRERTPRDQRVVRLFCTMAGRDLLTRAPGPMQGVLPDAVQRLSGRELAAMHRALSVLARHVKSIDRRAGKLPLSDLISPRERG